jgi:hypothetical protein
MWGIDNILQSASNIISGGLPAISETVANVGESIDNVVPLELVAAATAAVLAPELLPALAETEAGALTASEIAGLGNAYADLGASFAAADAAAAGAGALTAAEIAGLGDAYKDVALSSLTSSDVAALDALAEAAGITGIDASTVLPLDTMIGGQTLGNLLELSGVNALSPANLTDLLKVAKNFAPFLVGGSLANNLAQQTTNNKTYPIVPVPSYWKSPPQQQQFLPSAPIDFGSPELLSGTQWKKYINPSITDVINTINYQKPSQFSQYILPAYQSVPDINQVIGNLNNVPVSINDIISGITSGQNYSI